MPEAPAAGARPVRAPMDGGDKLILGAVAALLVLWIPNIGLPLLTPRMAIALVLAGPGLVVVGGLVRGKDLGARWIAAFLAWALVAALVSTSPRPALIGSYGSDIGWIWLASFVGAWGLGRRLGRPAVRLLPWVLVGGVAVNALFGILEAAFEPYGDLGPVGGRVLGLVTNPIFLAGLLCGGLALLGRLSATSSPRRWVVLGLIVVFAIAVNLSGSRAGLVCGALLAVAGAATAWRVQGAPWARAGVGALVVAAAVVLGVVLSGPLQAGTSGTGRIGEVSASSGYQSRTMAWGYGLDAAAERPLTGWGPGRFREAAGPRTTAAFVRSEGPDTVFYDAHNLFIEHLVGEGVVGLVLLLGFVVTAARRCRGPLAWFALGVAVTWLLNPLSVCTAPVALVALGGAWRRSPEEPPAAPAAEAADDGAVEPAAEVAVASKPSGRVGRTIGAVLAVVGLLLAVNLVVVDALVQQGTTNLDVVPLERAQQLYPGDATITGTVGDARGVVAEMGIPAAKRDVLVAARRATDEDPSRPVWWVRRGYAEAQMGTGTDEERLDAAERSFQRALDLNPWSVSAMNGMLAAAQSREDQVAIDRWTERLCEVDRCPEDP